MPKMTIITLLTAALAAFAPFSAQAETVRQNPLQGEAGKPDKAGRLTVNGIDYYYEIRGKGEPLLLLHGGLGQIEMFGANLKTLQESRQVIGVDLQGHGRTPLGTRPIERSLIRKYEFVVTACDRYRIYHLNTVDPVDVDVDCTTPYRTFWGQ